MKEESGTAAGLSNSTWAPDSHLVLVLLCVASLIVHLQDDFLQFLLRTPHKFGGGLPLPGEGEER